MPIVIHRECHTEMPNGRSLPMESRAKLLLLNDFGHVDKLPLPYQLSTSRRGWSPNVVIKMFSTPTLKKKKKKRENIRGRPDSQAGRPRIPIFHQVIQTVPTDSNI